MTTLHSFTEPKLYPVIMLKRMSVNVDGCGITAEEFEAEQEAQIPENVARALVRDGIAKWKSKIPPEIDKQTEEFLTEERRKAATFPGFSFVKTEGPTVHFSHFFTIDGKMVNLEFVGLFLDMSYWEKSPNWNSADPSRCATWDATAEMRLQDYLKNPPSQEQLGHVITRFVKTLNGEMKDQVRFSIPRDSRTRVYVTAGCGGNPAFFLFDAKSYTSYQQSSPTLKDLEMFCASRYATAWMEELLVWQAKHS